MDCNTGDDLKIKRLEKDEKTANELRIEINDSSSTHNNNFAISQLEESNVAEVVLVAPDSNTTGVPKLILASPLMVPTIAVPF